MFVTQKSYDRLLRAAAELEIAKRITELEYQELLNKWNDLVRQVNRGDLVPKSQMQRGTFTPDEIDALVRLCHPDKHGGSKAANDITARLLALRKTG